MLTNLIMQADENLLPSVANHRKKNKNGAQNPPKNKTTI